MTGAAARRVAGTLAERGVSSWPAMAPAPSPPEYVLGTSDHELARLRLQQEVWSEVTEGFLDTLGIPPGGRVLDVGCGPGLLLESFRRRVGPTGSVLGIDESARWIQVVGEEARARGWRNVSARQARIEELDLEGEGFDLIFLRWVLAFLPDPGAVVSRLASALRPGGALAVIDYNHEGVSLFPRSPGFEAMIRGVRRLYASRGGDTWIMGRLPGLLRAAGLEPSPPRPSVLAGGPSSGAFRWADAFFPYHADAMVEAGVVTPEERDAFRREWAERKADPDALFFSPIVVGAYGRRAEPRGR